MNFTFAALPMRNDCRRAPAFQAKVEQLKQGLQQEQRKHPEFFDFGLRRRFSGEWQDEVVATFWRVLYLSISKDLQNVYLAMKYGLTPVVPWPTSTFSLINLFGVRLRDFQKAALEDWVQKYRGDLGTALTDVVGMDAFLADFDLYFAKLFDGLRHDSGDPIVWGEKALAHYAKLRIDANSKRLVFSDGLDGQALCSSTVTLQIVS